MSKIKFNSDLYRKLSIAGGILLFLIWVGITVYVLSIPPSKPVLPHEDLRVGLFLGVVFGIPTLGMVFYSLYLNFEIEIGQELKIKNTGLFGKIDRSILFSDVSELSLNAIDSLKIGLKSGELITIPKYIVIQKQSLSADQLSAYEKLDSKNNMRNIVFLKVLISNRMKINS
ncbi:hypothetical protein [Bdellovibrio svalbardensis]|uniref:PH domain-containing protein n=1 Tax=Bdellovibrio svalbardensis TaxID=2972972 RepID=A0ABT6DKJ7_9BACT|nr:hypothetical protein [Bdellovibrio svalbardensis]MDG0816439.1 hypothetical protein [Bdellovibrio svalbardensis]